MTNAMISRTLKRLGSLLLLGLVFNACNDEADSLFDPDFGYDRAIPVVNSIEPSTGYLAGVDFITIVGENFHPTADSNRIYFDGQPGTILTSTQNLMEVRPAQVSGDDIEVKVAVSGAEQFSEPFSYVLNPPLLVPSPDLKDSDVANATFTDLDGNVYVHILRDGSTIGIQKIDAVTQAMSEFIPPNNISVFNDLLISSTGEVHTVQTKNGAVFSWVPGNSTRWSPKYIVGFTSSIEEIEYDEYGHLWTVGKSPSIARFEIGNPANKELFPLGHEFTTVRYFDGKLYVGGTIDDVLQIYTFDVDANGAMTNGQTFYTMSDFSQQEITTIRTMEIASDGTVYVGINSPVTSENVDGSVIYKTLDGIVQIAPDGSNAEYLYPGIVPGNIQFMFWGQDEQLNIVRSRTTIDVDAEPVVVQQQGIQQINMLDKRRAPFYGN